MAKTTTLREIAAAAGLSLAAVSCALRGRANIAPETRARVEALARKMGYVPNRNAALLGARRKLEFSKADTRPTLGYLTRGGTDDALCEPMRARASAMGYHFETYDVSGVKNWRRFLSVLWARGTQGLFIRESFGPELERSAEFARFCVIWVNSHPSPHELPYRRVRQDFETSLSVCWERALASGYRRIGCAHFAHEPVSLDDRRLHGVALEWRERAGGAHRRVPVLSTRHDDKAAFVKWVERYRPDCVVALHVAPWWWLRDAGWRVPEDIGLACPFRPGGLAGMPPISGFELRPETLVEHAIGWMGDLLARGEAGAPTNGEQMLFMPPWREGETLSGPGRSVGKDGT
jgi:DNA-binding LacI/PurR family transcriptional regulator